MAERLDRVEEGRRQRGPEAEDGAEHAGAHHAADDDARVDARGHRADQIDQRAESITSVQNNFALIDSLKGLRLT